MGATVATSMPSITEPSGYVLEPLRKGVEFTLYRGRQHGDRSRVLVVTPTAEQPWPQGLRRLEHEYSLAAELDPASDPGGEPLDRVLERPENAFVGGSIPSLATTK